RLLSPEGLPAFAEEKIAVPPVIERFVERVDSDQERRGLVEAPGLHQRPGQKVGGPDGLRVLRLALDDGPERPLRLGEAPFLIRAERPLVLAVHPAGGRRGRQGGERQQREEEEGAHVVGRQFMPKESWTFV